MSSGVMNKKYMKIHIWFVINLAAIVAFFYGGFFISLLASFVILLSSSFLLEKWEDIKNEYTSPMPKKDIFFASIFVLLLIVMAGSGLTAKFNKALNQPWVTNIAFVGLLCMIIIAYVIQLLKKKNEKTSHR
jgi:hypothetical protein